MNKRIMLFILTLAAFAPVFGCGAVLAPTISEVTYFIFGKGGGMEINSGSSYSARLENGVTTVAVRYPGTPEEEAVVFETDYPVLQKLREVIEARKLNRWNGFDKYNKHVMDGSSFSLYVQMDNGETIEAKGYEKWPSGYSEAAGDIIAVFNEAVENAEAAGIIPTAGEGD